MRTRSRGRRTAATMAFVAALTLMASTAHTAPTAIDDVLLTGPQGAEWDAEGDYDYGSGGPCYAREGFTPADDVNNDYSSDVFDGGLLLLVNGQTFGAGIETGNLTGQQIKVGPQRLANVKVTRIERALQSSPTLRSLIRFKNATKKARSLTLIWDSALGADEDEATRASSNAPVHAHTKADRWIVASDNPDSGSLSDPPVAFVFNGKRAQTGVAKVLYAPEDPAPATDREGCVSVRLRIKVPAKSTRYLLFFTEIGLSNEASISMAKKFNKRGLNNALLTGIPQNVRNKVLNWDLS